MRAFIYDCETTGLVKNSLIPLADQPRVIEFFGNLVDDESGEVLDEVEFFCDPGVPLSNEITRITGIKPEQLIGQPPFSAFADKVAELGNAADAIVSHNLSFDFHLINCEMARCSKSWEPRRLICTVEETEWIKGHRLSLGMLHEHLFGEPFKGAHRARVDVEALTKCYLELRKRGDL